VAGRLKGKVAVVTGAGNGIGRAAALTLAQEGAGVVCVGGQDTATEIRAGGGLAIFTDADVSEMAGGERVIELAVTELGRLDILVNAAAGLDQPDDPRWGGGLADLSPEDFYAAVRTGLKATFTPTRHAAGVFRKQRSGRIVSVTSDAGLGEPNAASRAAVSEGIIGLTRTVGRDLGKYGVTANAVVADDEAAAAALIGALCTDALANINARTLGTRDGSVFLYEEPNVVAGLHKWGKLTLDDLDDLVPRTLLPALSLGPAAGASL
jgi:NAD(P)-dependent dehydrogenase (short-subunit alcohol dehydrogenase family)